MKVAQKQAIAQQLANTSQELPVQVIRESDFEDICHLIAEICHTPVTLVSVIDSGREWFRSNHPLISADLVADFAFCNQAQHSPTDIFIIPDLVKDYRFGKHLLATSVPYAAFYCGIPLLNAEGKQMAVLCIWDNKPRELNASQLSALQSLSRQTASKMELRRQVMQLGQNEAKLKEAYAKLDSFATIAAHDLKSPLNAIISLTDLLLAGHADALDEEGKEYIQFLHVSAKKLTDLITHVLKYSKSAHLPAEHKDKIIFPELVAETIGLLKIPPGITIRYDETPTVIYINRTVLSQILLQLIDNALKFNDKEQIEIEITLQESASAYIISIKDNGKGIAKAGRENLFDLFKKIPANTDGGEKMGIGLAIVKKLTDRMDGSISIESEPGTGSTFTVSLPR